MSAALAAERAARDAYGRLLALLAARSRGIAACEDAVPGAGAGPHDLVDEALFLGRLLVALLPDEPEPKGLLALMLYCEARRPARRAADGSFLPLHRQDARLWRHDMIVEAEAHLTAAAHRGTFGRYQCESAIQSVHVQSPITGRTNHAALGTLYGLLARGRSPSLRPGRSSGPQQLLNQLVDSGRGRPYIQQHG